LARFFRARYDGWLVFGLWKRLACQRLLGGILPPTENAGYDVRNNVRASQHGLLSLGPTVRKPCISLQFKFDWQSGSAAAQLIHPTLSHGGADGDINTLFSHSLILPYFPLKKKPPPKKIKKQTAARRTKGTISSC
jgi:hypothetical protein